MKENLIPKCLPITIYEDKEDEYEVFIPETLIIAYMDIPEKLGDRVISYVDGRISNEVRSRISFYIRHHAKIYNEKICEFATEEFIDLANNKMKLVLGTAIIIGYQTTFVPGTGFPIFERNTLSRIETTALIILDKKLKEFETVNKLAAGKDSNQDRLMLGAYVQAFGLPRPNLDNESGCNPKEMEEEINSMISADRDSVYNRYILDIYGRALGLPKDTSATNECKTKSKLLRGENKDSQFYTLCGRDDVRITETDMEYHIHIPEKVITGPNHPAIHVENLDYMLGSVLRSNINTFFPIRHEHIRFTTTYADTKNGNIVEAPLFRIKTHDVLGYFGYDESQPYNKHSVGVLGSLIRRAYNNLYSSIRTVEIHDIDSADLNVKWIELTENLVITVGDNILTNTELQHFGDYLWRNVPLDNIGRYREIEFNIEDSPENTLVSWKMPTDEFKEMIESDGRNQEIRRIVLDHIKRG